MNQIEKLLLCDKKRMAILAAVATLDLPDGYVAAGFVRNLIWDDLHRHDEATPLNDVDVIYFDETERLRPELIEQQLRQVLPEVNWEVKNQAVMHRRNGDRPYTSTADAMTFWPEKETAVGVRLTGDREIELSAPFGIDSLLTGRLTHNPKRSRALFDERVRSKKWLERWPRLTVVVSPIG